MTLPSLLLLAVMILPAAAIAESTAVSNVTPPETLVLFDAAASRDADGGSWRIPVHAWVYVPQNSRARKAAIATLLRSRYGLTASPETAAPFDSRVNLLLADNKHRRRIVVEVAGLRFALPPTRRDGHVRAEIVLPAAIADDAAANGRLPLVAVLAGGDGRRIEGHAILVPRSGLSVISDIDDTVKISNVTERASFWASTFFKPWTAVPGMAELYQRLSARGVAFYYVSSTPWHLYAPLAEFLAAAQFPPAALTLKHIRLKDSSLFNILRSPSATKPPQIEAILARWPERRFILIGDSGEKDPEVYAGVLRRHPGRIEQILIRNVTGARPDDERFAAVFAGIDPGRWQLFDVPGDIRLLA